MHTAVIVFKERCTLHLPVIKSRNCNASSPHLDLFIAPADAIDMEGIEHQKLLVVLREKLLRNTFALVKVKEVLVFSHSF